MNLQKLQMSSVCLIVGALCWSIAGFAFPQPQSEEQNWSETGKADLNRLTSYVDSRINLLLTLRGDSFYDLGTYCQELNDIRIELDGDKAPRPEYSASNPEVGLLRLSMAHLLPNRRELDWSFWNMHALFYNRMRELYRQQAISLEEVTRFAEGATIGWEGRPERRGCIDLVLIQITSPNSWFDLSLSPR